MPIPGLSSQITGIFCFALMKPGVATLLEAQAMWKGHVDATIKSLS